MTKKKKGSRSPHAYLFKCHALIPVSELPSRAVIPADDLKKRLLVGVVEGLDPTHQGCLLIKIPGHQSKYFYKADKVAGYVRAAEENPLCVLQAKLDKPRPQAQKRERSVSTESSSSSDEHDADDADDAEKEQTTEQEEDIQIVQDIESDKELSLLEKLAKAAERASLLEVKQRDGTAPESRLERLLRRYPVSDQIREADLLIKIRAKAARKPVKSSTGNVSRRESLPPQSATPPPAHLVNNLHAVPVVRSRGPATLQLDSPVLPALQDLGRPATGAPQSGTAQNPAASSLYQPGPGSRPATPQPSSIPHTGSNNLLHGGAQPISAGAGVKQAVPLPLSSAELLKLQVQSLLAPLKTAAPPPQGAPGLPVTSAGIPMSYISTTSQPGFQHPPAIKDELGQPATQQHTSPGFTGLQEVRIPRLAARGPPTSAGSSPPPQGCALPPTSLSMQEVPGHDLGHHHEDQQKLHDRDVDQLQQQDGGVVVQVESEGAHVQPGLQGQAQAQNQQAAAAQRRQHATDLRADDRPDTKTSAPEPTQPERPQPAELTAARTETTAAATQSNAIGNVPGELPKLVAWKQPPTVILWGRSDPSQPSRADGPDQALGGVVRPVRNMPPVYKSYLRRQIEKLRTKWATPAMQQGDLNEVAAKLIKGEPAMQSNASVAMRPSQPSSLLLSLHAKQLLSGPFLITAPAPKVAPEPSLQKADSDICSQKNNAASGQLPTDGVADTATHPAIVSMDVDHDLDLSTLPGSLAAHIDPNDACYLQALRIPMIRADQLPPALPAVVISRDPAPATPAVDNREEGSSNDGERPAAPDALPVMRTRQAQQAVDQQQLSVGVLREGSQALQQQHVISVPKGYQPEPIPQHAEWKPTVWTRPVRGSTGKLAVKDLVNKLVDIPATEFKVDIPGLMYRARVVGPDNNHADACVVRLLEDGSRYFFRVGQVREWLTDTEALAAGQKLIATKFTTTKRTHAFVWESLLQLSREQPEHLDLDELRYAALDKAMRREQGLDTSSSDEDSGSGDDDEHDSSDDEKHSTKKRVQRSDSGSDSDSSSGSSDSGSDDDGRARRNDSDDSDSSESGSRGSHSQRARTKTKRVASDDDDDEESGSASSGDSSSGSGSSNSDSSGSDSDSHVDKKASHHHKDKKHKPDRPSQRRDKAKDKKSRHDNTSSKVASKPTKTPTTKAAPATKDDNSEGKGSETQQPEPRIPPVFQESIRTTRSEKKHQDQQGQPKDCGVPGLVMVKVPPAMPQATPAGARHVPGVIMMGVTDVMISLAPVKLPPGYEKLMKKKARRQHKPAHDAESDGSSSSSGPGSGSGSDSDSDSGSESSSGDDRRRVDRKRRRASASSHESSSSSDDDTSSSSSDESGSDSDSEQPPAGRTRGTSVPAKKRSTVAKTKSEPSRKQDSRKRLKDKNNSRGGNDSGSGSDESSGSRSSCDDSQSQSGSDTDDGSSDGSRGSDGDAEAAQKSTKSGQKPAAKSRRPRKPGKEPARKASTPRPAQSTAVHKQTAYPTRQRNQSTGKATTSGKPAPRAVAPFKPKASNGDGNKLQASGTGVVMASNPGKKVEPWSRSDAAELLRNIVSRMSAKLPTKSPTGAATADPGSTAQAVGGTAATAGSGAAGPGGNAPDEEGIAGDLAANDIAFGDFDMDIDCVASPSSVVASPSLHRQTSSLFVQQAHGSDNLADDTHHAGAIRQCDNLTDNHAVANGSTPAPRAPASDLEMAQS